VFERRGFRASRRSRSARRRFPVPRARPFQARGRETRKRAGRRKRGHPPPPAVGVQSHSRRGTGAGQSSVCPYRRPGSRFSPIRPRTCVAARTSPPRTVATRRTRPITGVGGFGKEKCGDGRARRNIPPRTGNEPVAGDASETAIFVGTHLSQQTPPEECMTGVREGDAKLCRRGSSFDERHFPIAKDDASRDETFFQLFAEAKGGPRFAVFRTARPVRSEVQPVLFLIHLAHPNTSAQRVSKRRRQIF